MALQLELNQNLWTDFDTFEVHAERMKWMQAVLRTWLRHLEAFLVGGSGEGLLQTIYSFV